MTTIIDVYQKGLIDLIDSFNQISNPRYSEIYFCINRKETHVAERIAERKIDPADLFKLSKSILRNHLCQMIYAVHSGNSKVVIATKVGNLVFRCYHSPERGGYIVKLTSATTAKMHHSLDFIVKGNV